MDILIVMNAPPRAIQTTARYEKLHGFVLLLELDCEIPTHVESQHPTTFNVPFLFDLNAQKCAVLKEGSPDSCFFNIVLRHFAHL